MIKKRIFSLVFLIGGIAASAVFAQELPVLKTVLIQAEVSFSPATGIFTYSYTVTNLSTNKGQIGFIDIDISKVTGGAELSGEGLVNIGSFTEHSSKLILEQSQSASPAIPVVPMIPVGMTSPPNWIGGLSVGGTAGWGNTDEPFRILPGESVSGYQLTSRGLPGIRAFDVAPHLDYDNLPIEPPEEPEDLERYNKEFDALHESVAAKGKTVGPTAPPADFKPVAFLTYIEGLKEEAVKLGWITSAGIANSLDVKLNAAKRALERGETITAKNILLALVNEVEAKTDKKHLTSEAVALMKFNTDFLISKLP